MRLNFKEIVVYLSVACTTIGISQAQQAGSLNSNATLDELINYALSNKIELKQAQIDQEIGEREIASALSGWYPQLNASGNYTHNIQVPTINMNGSNIPMGQKNTASMVFQAEQAIINPGLFQASRAAQYIRQQNNLNVEDTRINTIVD